MMTNLEYADYNKNRKKAIELHNTVKELVLDSMGFEPTSSHIFVNDSKLHAYARCKGLITKEERDFLRRYYEQ